MEKTSADVKFAPNPERDIATEPDADIRNLDSIRGVVADKCHCLCNLGIIDR